MIILNPWSSTFRGKLELAQVFKNFPAVVTTRIVHKYMPLALTMCYTNPFQKHVVFFKDVFQ